MAALGTRAPDFALPDGDGVEHAPGGPATVVYFTSNRCPHARRWQARLGRAALEDMGARSARARSGVRRPDAVEGRDDRAAGVPAPADDRGLEDSPEGILRDEGRGLAQKRVGVEHIGHGDLPARAIDRDVFVSGHGVKSHAI